MNREKSVRQTGIVQPQGPPTMPNVNVDTMTRGLNFVMQRGEMMSGSTLSIAYIYIYIYIFYIIYILHSSRATMKERGTVIMPRDGGSVERGLYIKTGNVRKLRPYIMWS